jgi:hypothetical protein
MGGNRGSHPIKVNSETQSLVISRLLIIIAKITAAKCRQSGQILLSIEVGH